jgi:hypothetical protein
MNKILMLLGCAFLLLGGCQEYNRNKSDTAAAPSEFPRSLAGLWEANKNNANYWQIIFGPDGTISSAVIPLGEVEVRPNRRTEIPDANGNVSFFDAGDFDVFYNRKGRELAVNVKIKQFNLYVVNGGMLKGSWEYLITGKVSKDGKIWAGEILNSPDIVALVPDPNSPKGKPTFKEEGKLRIGLGEEEGENIVFTKTPDVNAGLR